MDLMPGINTELRDENAEGKYKKYPLTFTVTSFLHAHVDSDSRAPGEPLLSHRINRHRRERARFRIESGG